MTCDDVFDGLTDLLDGALPRDVEVAALEHLASCRRCEMVLAETRELVETARDERPPGLDREQHASVLTRVLGEIRPDSEA